MAINITGTDRNLTVRGQPRRYSACRTEYDLDFQNLVASFEQQPITWDTLR